MRKTGKTGECRLSLAELMAVLYKNKNILLSNVQKKRRRHKKGLHISRLGSMIRSSKYGIVSNDKKQRGESHDH